MRPLSFYRAFQILPVMALIICCLHPVSAQDDGTGTVFFIMDFMKSNPAVDYLDYEETVWKPIHQERIRRGEIEDWFVVSVAYPNGASAEYDYVTITVITDPMKLEDPFPDAGEVIRTVHPDVNWEAFDQQTDNARTWVRSEVFYIIDSAEIDPYEENSDNDSGGWARVNFMRVSEADSWQYETMESEVYKPIQQAAIEAGAMADWLLLGRLMPAGSDLPFQYITIDVFDSWETYVTPIPGGLWESVHPGMDETETWQKMANLRTIGRAEMWRAVISALD